MSLQGPLWEIPLAASRWHNPSEHYNSTRQRQVLLIFHFPRTLRKGRNSLEQTSAIVKSIITITVTTS